MKETKETEMTYKAWVKSLAKDSKECRKFFLRSDDREVIYRDSMGSSHYYDSRNEVLPEFVKCSVMGMRVWVGECEKVLGLDGEYRYMSKMALSTHAVTSAYSPRGRNCLMLKRDTVRASGSVYSKQCIGVTIKECPKSGELTHVSDMADFRGEMVSTRWLEQYRGSLVMQNHSWRPDEFIIPDCIEYAGLELEVEDPGSGMHAYYKSAEFLKETLGDISFMKRDGSLVNGYELVTHPISWETIRERVAPAVDEIRKMGMLSEKSGRCGLHVHMPKAHLTKMEVAKFVVLWNSDHQWIEAISGRSAQSSRSRNGSSYCRLDTGRKLMFNGGPSCVDHYSAINTTNEHTMEIRSFRGTTNPNTFLARIGIGFMVRSYLKTCGANPSWDQFLTWCAKHPHERKRFPETWAFLAAKSTKHLSFSPRVREEVASIISKKSKSGTSQEEMSPMETEEEAESPLDQPQEDLDSVPRAMGTQYRMTLQEFQNAMRNQISTQTLDF